MAAKKEAELTKEAPEMVKETPEQIQKRFLNEKVSMLIPKDMTNPKNTDATVQVNGKTWLFERGKTVKVPRYVYLAYKDAETQQNAAIDLMAKIAQDN